MAIGGLVSDSLEGGSVHSPLLGEVPFFRTFFSARATRRSETELIIFVSPELVHPLEAEEVPLILPGMEITEPTNWEFFVKGSLMGTPGYHYRSTVWPEQRDRIMHAKHVAMKEARRQARYQNCEAFYLYGNHGFSK